MRVYESFINFCIALYSNTRTVKLHRSAIQPQTFADVVAFASGLDLGPHGKARCRADNKYFLVGLSFDKLSSTKIVQFSDVFCVCVCAFVVVMLIIGTS